MLNKFKIEVKELFFRVSFQKYLTSAFHGFLSKFTYGKPKLAQEN